MTEARQSLEAKLKLQMAAKRAAKGRDEVAFVAHAHEIVDTIRAIWQLPEDNALTDFQIGSYCWALYAIASKARDGEVARNALARLVRAYRKKIDSPQFWGSAASAEYGKTLFRAIVLLVYQMLKHSNEGAGESLLKKIGTPFLEILDLRASSFLDEAAFKKDPVTEEQRLAMERSAGKRIRMKAWPSVVEKAFGVMNRILKALPEANPSSELVAFLAQNISRGDWLGYYCAKARIRIGEYSGARALVVKMLRKKAAEGWLWADLAEACHDRQEVAVSCLAKALQCPNRDPQIAEGIAKRNRRNLTQLLANLGRPVAPEDLCADFYRDEARKAEKLVFGEGGQSHMDGHGETVLFSGKLRKKTGHAFGFVQDGKLGSVFVPPRFADRCRDGGLLRGKAVQKEDKKKKRLSWCVISVL